MAVFLGSGVRLVQVLDASSGIASGTAPGVCAPGGRHSPDSTPYAAIGLGADGLAARRIRAGARASLCER